jgi:hypothetical protein
VAEAQRNVFRAEVRLFSCKPTIGFRAVHLTTLVAAFLVAKPQGIAFLGCYVYSNTLCHGRGLYQSGDTNARF